MAAGGAVQLYTSAVFWRGFSVFFDAMIGTFGWGRGPTAAALSIQRIQGGMVSPFVGTLLNRYGPRKVMAFGVTVTGLAFVLLSQVQTLWQFYLVIILLTIGMSFGTFIVLVVSVGNWFVRRRALALGILMSTSGFGGLTLPLLNDAVEGFGWREVMFAIGIGFWIVGFAATFVMRGPPENYGLLPDGDVPEEDDADTAQNATDGRGTKRPRHAREVTISTRDSLKMRFFWQLAIASSLGQFVSASNLTHIEALKNYGISGAAAASAVGAVAVGDVVGRASIAFLGDRMNKRLLLTAAFAIESLGILAIGVVNATIFGVSLGHFPIPVYSVAFGLGFGGSVPLRLALLADYFGRRNYGSIVGLTSSVNAAFGASGAAFAGFMFDVTGSYRLPFTIMAGMLFLAVPLTLALESESRVAARTRYARRRSPRSTAAAPAGGEK